MFTCTKLYRFGKELFPMYLAVNNSIMKRFLLKLYWSWVISDLFPFGGFFWGVISLWKSLFPKTWLVHHYVQEKTECLWNPRLVSMEHTWLFSYLPHKNVNPETWSNQGDRWRGFQIINVFINPLATCQHYTEEKQLI